MTRQVYAPRVLVAVLVSIFLATLSFAVVSAAGPPTGNVLYVVQYGDTLESIAARFGVSPQAIVQANSGMYRSAYVGQQMYLPYGRSYSPVSYANTSVYVVQPGDSLFGIAQRFGVSTNLLMQLNHIYNPNVIFAGMSLRVPGTSYPPRAYQTYVIHFGDTLSSIAVRFGTTVYSLMISNNIPNANLIFAGMRLSVPMSSTYVPTNGTHNNPSTNSNYGNRTSPMPMVAPPTSQPATVSPPGNTMISLRNLAFNPKTVTLHQGTTVVWRNDEPSSIPHTVTSGAPGAPTGMFDSGTLNPGQSFQFTFNSAGTFAYYCRIHGAMMTGTIVVTP